MRLGQLLDRAFVQTYGLHLEDLFAKVQTGDVVLAVNGRRIRSADEVKGMAAELASPRVTLQVEREGRVMVLSGGAGR